MAIQIEVLNARLAEVIFDKEGFKLVEHEAPALDLASHEHAEEEQYTEIRAFAKAHAGCDFVLFFPEVCETPPLLKMTQTTILFNKR